MHAPSSEHHHGDASSAVSLTDSSILLLLLLQTAKVAPGGVEVTTGGGGGAVRVWDVRSWRCVDELPPSTYGSAGTRCALQRCEQSQMRCDAVRRLAPPTPSPGVYRGAAASREGLRWFGVLSEGSSKFGVSRRGCVDRTRAVCCLSLMSVVALNSTCEHIVVGGV